MFTGIESPETWIALLTLVAMEVVLGIDNIVFITILTGRLPEAQRERTARIGIGLALVLRILLLLGIGWVMGLTNELANVAGVSITGKSLILLGGGLLLIGKAVLELHHKVEDASTPETATTAGSATVGRILAQILLLDLVFSLDSVITAVGMIPPEQLWVMITAVLVSVAVMLVGAKPISDFVLRHPTMKVLALAFLILIGVLLVAEGLGQHISKGTIYFAMAFSFGVEMLNLRIRPRRPIP